MGIFPTTKLRLSLNSHPAPRRDVPTMDLSSDLTTEHRVRPTCHCLGVHADEIRQAIDEQACGTVRQVTQACGAGGGCTACHRHIKRFLAEAQAAQLADSRGVVYGFA